MERETPSTLSHLALLAAFIVLAAGATGCSRPAPPVIAQLPEFELVSQEGAPFRSSERLAGKVWVADFMFTSCLGPCPRMTAQMRRLQKDYGRHPDLRFVSITVDPETDTPEKLREFAGLYRAEPGWYFLTGPMNVLDNLAYKGFMLGNVDGSFQHSTRFVLVDRESRIRGYYETTDEAEMKQLREDLQTLLRERL